MYVSMYIAFNEIHPAYLSPLTLNLSYARDNLGGYFEKLSVFMSISSKVIT